MSLQLKTWQRAVLVTALAGMALALLGWRCVRDPKITFLTAARPAEWILFPSAADATLHGIVNLEAVFRRDFTLTDPPRTARLSVRSAKIVRLKINGTVVQAGADRNWKEISSANVLAWLRAGTNTIEASVLNDSGLPALWLVLATDQSTLRSDSTWETSIAGSAWRHAKLASIPRLPGKGNLIGGGEGTLTAVAAVWPTWAAFGVLAIVLWMAGWWWLDRNRLSGAVATCVWSPRAAIVPLVLVATLWLILFCHNITLLPRLFGFDVQAHVDYVKYIQAHGALPLPNEGFEMYQPPLYYGISAITLSSFGLSVTQETGVMVLRLLMMLFGIVHCALVLLCLRLLFPNRISLHWVGLLLAAFLPMHLYLSHYVTNETLAALLVSASVYLCLRILRTETNSWANFGALGFVLGAALLAKVTAVLAVPIIILALASKLVAPRLPMATWPRNLCLVPAVCFAVCGWYYIRVWLHFGSPFIANWDPASGFGWWQDEGCRTAAYYARFGRSLLSPLFSGFAGFADGIYSTLWGDGLCGGVAELAQRPPWNYNLVAAGYLLALVPMLTILTGAVTVFWRFIRGPSANWFLLLGLSGAVVFALISVSLKVPAISVVKAFFGLCALVPLCLFGAVGWEVLTRGRKPLQFALGVALLVWAMNSFASVWIRGGSAPTHICRGFKLMVANQTDAAAAELARAVDVDPSNVQARRFLAMTLNRLGKSAEALEQAGRAVQLNPADPACHLQLGVILAGQARLDRAISEARAALESGPEYVEAYERLCGWLLKAGQADNAIQIARDGLAVAPTDPPLHFALGLALARKGEFAAATNQFAYALSLGPDLAQVHFDYGLALLQQGSFDQAVIHWEAFLRQNPGDARAHRFLAAALVNSGNAAEGLEHLRQAVQLAPDSPETLDDLAWLLATHPNAALRNGQEAVRLAEHACALAGRKDPKLLGTLAAAYAEAGRFPDAINTTREAIELAQAAGEKDLLARNQEMLGIYQSGHAYRQNAGPPK